MLFNTAPTKTKLTHHGCYGVVEAFNDSCDEALSFVAYSVSGIDMVITKHSAHPSLSIKDVKQVGAIMEAELVKEARKIGVRQIFFLHADNSVEVVCAVDPCISALNQSSTKHQYLIN
jgi:hypothetical protein